MNLEIFKNSDPSGRMSKESYLIKNYKDEYDYILNYCQLKSIETSFKEKVYLCLNRLEIVPICKNPNCNKRVKFKNSTIGYLKYCSNKCISSDPEIIKIKEQKSLDKFGTKSPAQSNSIKEKIIKTNLERWGGNSPMSNDLIKEKSKKTLKQNWGVDHPSKSDDILTRRVRKFKENIEKYKESYKNTSIERYGVEHPWMCVDIHKKTIKTSKESKIKNTKSIILNMIPKNYRIDSTCFETGEFNIFCDLGHEFKATRNFIYNRFRINCEICTICNPISNQRSGSEISLYKFIKENYNGLIVENERNIIKPFEVDIYLPDLNLAIEYNGLWWHSSEYREYDYHLLKQRKSIKCDLNLFTIWEDDWIYKSDIVKSFLISKLGGLNNMIDSHVCDIVEVCKNDSDVFLDKNHLNGRSKSSVRISLKLKNDIVSMMTFKKNGNGWRLDRFCDKNYTSVLNSFNKILNFFIDRYNPSFILSYSDNMISDENIYLKFGFKCDLEITPTYTLLVNKKRAHRLSIKDIDNYPKIWNAGNKKWVLIINNES